MTHDCRPLSVDDALAGLRLSTAAGWNQTLFDWLMLLGSGRGYGFFDSNRLIATTLYLPYPSVAWICMVLVDARWRRRGLATRLMERCLRDIESAGLIPMLDATDQGCEIYAKLGFEMVESISRFSGKPAFKTVPALHRIRSITAGDLARICEIDAHAFASGRSDLISAWSKTASGICTTDLAGRPAGFGFCRPGRLAAHVGPVIAQNREDAQRLVTALLARRSGSVFIDVPDTRKDLLPWLHGRNFRPVRHFARMALGAKRAPSANDLFAIAGPEWG